MLTFVFLIATIATILSSLSLVATSPFALPLAVYRLLKHRTWHGADPLFDNQSERRQYFDAALREQGPPPFEWSRFLYFTLPPVFALQWIISTPNDARGAQILFFVSMVNASIVAFVLYLNKERRKNAEAALREMNEEHKAEEHARRRTAEGAKRAERQEQSDRDYAERLHREQARRRQQDEREKARRKQRQSREEERKSSEDRSNSSAPADGEAWHKVLGVPPDAPTEEIKRAYHSLLKQYHPDRVHELGDELKELATRKTAELNRAYNEALAEG